MSKKYLLTPEGLEKLNAELKALINDKRKEVIERIREAAAHGDLSENADYAQAREEQSFIEGRIAEIEDIIKNAEIITTNSHHHHVSIGSTVIVKVNDTEKKYTIVGGSEANPKEGKISNESPIGQAFLGHKVDDIVEVKAPKGILKFKILKIS